MYVWSEAVPSNQFNVTSLRENGAVAENDVKSSRNCRYVPVEAEINAPFEVDDHPGVEEDTPKTVPPALTKNEWEPPLLTAFAPNVLQLVKPGELRIADANTPPVEVATIVCVPNEEIGRSAVDIVKVAT
jgi:hypothetical protein